MKIRSKIFTTTDVQAILDKRKTMFREPVKSKHESGIFQVSTAQYEPNCRGYYHNRCIHSLDWDERIVDGGDILCPYGEVGDVIYVREKWQLFFNAGDCGVGCENGCRHGKYVYAATGIWDDEVKWQSAATMPREAARIWLQITDIKVERWRDITEEDAIAEGVERNRDGSWHDYLEPNRLYQDCPKASFYSLCLKIHGYKKWIDNPWVWAISFKVLSTSGKPENLTT